MGGKLGTENIKKVMTLGKLGAISFFQAVSKDGFQLTDITAPLRSPMFQNALIGQQDTIIEAIKESKELDWGDRLAIGDHAWNCIKDMKTEAYLALKKVQAKV